jgi:uncharacterized SAM-binding protein YcdF (DUF218 family)
MLSSFLVALWWIHPFLLAEAGRWLNIGEQLAAPVDAVLVLGGGSDSRPFQAAAIYRSGYAATILIPRFVDSSTDDQNETEVIRDVLESHGVPAEAIVELDVMTISTRGEITALKKYVAEHPQETIAIVTSDFHTRRARLLAHRAVKSASRQLHMIATPTDGYSPENWWHTPAGTNMYILEYGKLLRDWWQ